MKRWVKYVMMGWIVAIGALCLGFSVHDLYEEQSRFHRLKCAVLTRQVEKQEALIERLLIWRSKLDLLDEPVSLHDMLEPIQAEAAKRGEHKTAAAINFIQYAITSGQIEGAAIVLETWAKRQEEMRTR